MKNLVLIGMPGCGKSSIGKCLADRLCMQFVDTDERIEAAEGRQIKEIFAAEGEAYFRDRETDCIAQAARCGGAVLSTGGGAVLREENMTALRENGVIIFIDRPVDEILESVKLDDRPLLADAQERIYHLYRERIGLYLSYGDFRVRNEGCIDQVIEQIHQFFIEGGDEN